MNDSNDFLDPEELLAEASHNLLEALATLDRIRRVLRGHPEPPRPEPLNVLPFSVRLKSVSPSPGGRGGMGAGKASDQPRGGQGVRGRRRRNE